MTAPNTLHFTIVASSLGQVLVGRHAGAEGVAAILLGDASELLIGDLQARFPDAVLERADGPLSRLAAMVVTLVDGAAADSDLPLDLRGTPFQRTVWRALRNIPPGATATYSDIAVRIGRPTSARAVAAACAANPLAVAVPCHRVVRRDGSLSGYRWGVERKRSLLDREVGAATS